MPSSILSSMPMSMSYSITSPVLKMHSVINHKEKFPRKIRIAINEEIIIRKESIANRASISKAKHKARKGIHNKMKRMKDNINTDTAIIFLTNLYTKIIDFLFANSYSNNVNPNRGLNYDYDTVKEVETMIRFFPDSLKGKIRNGAGQYSITCQATNHRGEFNLKSIPFLPIMAELGIELGMGEYAIRKEKELRGGLIGTTVSTNMIRLLVTTNDNCLTNKLKTKDENENEKTHLYCNRIDIICLDIIKQLQKKNLFHKEDIRKYKLLDILCSQDAYFFPERRFRYLVDWDPDSLVSSFGRPYCPLHYSCKSSSSNSIRGFQIVFETGIQLFPRQFGFLFHKDGIGRTSYQLACDKYGKKKIDLFIDDIIISTMNNNSNSNNNNNNNSNSNNSNNNDRNATTANNHVVGSGAGGGTGTEGSIDNTITMMMKALIFAATEDNISLEGVYFFVRREPTICSL